MGVKTSSLSSEVVKQLEFETEYTPEEIRKYYRIFQRNFCSETKKNNYITKHNFLDRCQARLEEDASLIDCRRFASEVFDIFDCDESGTIDFYEFFIAMVTIKHGTMDEQAELAFRLYDQDGDGILTRNEVLQKVADLQAILGDGIKCVHKFAVAETLVDYIMSRADENKDGILSMDEFVSAVKRSQTTRNLFWDTSNAVRFVFTGRRLFE